MHVPLSYRAYQVSSHELKAVPHLRRIEYLKLVHENLDPSASLSAVEMLKRGVTITCVANDLTTNVATNCTTTKCRV